jgi:hypothetical protein
MFAAPVLAWSGKLAAAIRAHLRQFERSLAFATAWFTAAEG